MLAFWHLGGSLSYLGAPWETVGPAGRTYRFLETNFVFDLAIICEPHFERFVWAPRRTFSFFSFFLGALPGHFT